MKSSIITISGPPGSGTSTIAKRVANELKFDHYSSGDFMREIARDRDLTLAELQKKAEQSPEIDREIDAKNKSLIGAEKIVLDSRLAFHFIPDTFAVFLDVSVDEAARRIYNDQNKSRKQSGEARETLSEVKAHVQTRIESDTKRYADLYNLDYTDPDHFNIVIDTDKNNINTITQEVIQKYHSWQES